MMKFGHSIVINRPRTKVVEFFVNPQYLKEYQEGFVSKELTSGVEGESGAVSKMIYNNGKQEMILAETIVANNLPDSFEAFYHHKHMDNTYKSSFIALNENQTRYEIEGEYTRISWVMPKLMMLLFPKMFKNQPKKWMVNFKNYIEDNL